MSKITAPLLSFGATGTIADTMVYSKWRGRPYVRRHVIPSNPNTTGQQATRNVFAAASAIWKVAPALFVAPWDRFATGKPLTGRNKFQGSYTTLTRSKADRQDMLFSPGAFGGLPPSTMVVTPADDEFGIAFTTPTPPTGWTLDSAIAACIEDEDPATGTDYVITADEDDVTKSDVTLTGLKDATDYVIGGWLRWLKPDGSIAYSVSLIDVQTTL